MTETAPSPEVLYGAPVEWSHGQQVLHVSRETYLDTVQQLKDDGFNFCSDIAGVDYLANPTRVLPDGVRPERFEIVVNLLSHREKRRIRLRVQVPADDPVVPTLFDLYPGTEAPEREVFDLMGIVFSDHPDLTRILMPEDWEGHPLRKDYAQGRVPVQFKFPAGRYGEDETRRGGNPSGSAQDASAGKDPS